MTILWFNEEVDLRTVGGKGFDLCRLFRAGLPVPPGFCVPEEDLCRLDLPEVQLNIENALTRLGLHSVAVRSSAVDEDGVASSFAGIYPTRLNVTGAESVLAALRELYMSRLSPESLAYRQRRGFTTPPGMIGVVQEFLRAEVSGVLFMRDPIDHSERFIVEASWGLGEGVVSGLVTPDRWILSPDGALISACIAEKDVAVVPDETGTRIVDVEEKQRGVPCLTPVLIRELVQLAQACGRIFGGPRDIEWAVTPKQLWLLQSRSITC
jgi:phosphoenolpyruvate synthase/pyruvate phosphate dikinase